VFEPRPQNLMLTFLQTFCLLIVSFDSEKNKFGVLVPDAFLVIFLLRKKHIKISIHAKIYQIFPFSFPLVRKNGKAILYFNSLPMRQNIHSCTSTKTFVVYLGG
jgi:hypothetical protein